MLSYTCAMPSNHFDGRRFFNPATPRFHSFRDVQKMLREPRAPWPGRLPVEPRRPPAPVAGQVIATFVGHSTFLLQTPAGNLLTDPVWSERASPVQFAGPRRRRGPGVRLDDLPEIHVVLLSHNHYDHCDLPTLRRIAKRWNPAAITPLGNARLLRGAGFGVVHEVDWWDAQSVNGLTVTAVPAQHFSGRGFFDRMKALWSGFHVDAAGLRVLFAGDTGYAGHFTAMRERLGPPDLALLPIGAYEPRWFMKVIHVNPAESVQAHLDLASRQSVAMHFGTFNLTPEGVDEPPKLLREELAARGIPDERFRVLDVGGSLAVGRAG